MNRVFQEFLNLQLFELAKTYHAALANIDVSAYSEVHAGNVSTELACMQNLQEHVDLTSLPVLPHLLSGISGVSPTPKLTGKGFKAPVTVEGPGKLHVPAHFVHDLASEFIEKYKLNSDQSLALWRAADMMNKDSEQLQSVLLIHGVFGAGKSFLLSVLILFLVEVFTRNDTYSPGVPFPWKLLLSSTTNVAVDRVLLGLLELGFDDFVRVGSVKKIAKLVLPYSVHASGSESQELKDLQEMLKSADITPAEKQ
nr:hypothetical protein BaRGS_024612 [Batillaria attramentaria]